MNNEELFELVLGIICILYVIGVPFGMHYLRERTVKNLPKWIEKHPNVYQYFSIKKIEYACLFPKKILDRKIYNLVPNDVKGQLFNNRFPAIAVDSEVILDRPPNQNVLFSIPYLNFTKGASFLLENGMSVYTVWHSLIFMSEKLGVPISKKVSHYGDDLVKVAEKDSSVLYLHRGLRQRDYILALMHMFNPLKHKDIERQLRLICGAMNIDYDSACNGSYNPNYSKYIGWGSLSAAATGWIMTGISKQKAKASIERFNFAVIYVSFNNIAAYFNQVYYPEAYKLWMEEQKQSNIQLAQ